jgi:hypothetical protein
MAPSAAGSHLMQINANAGRWSRISAVRSLGGGKMPLDLSPVEAEAALTAHVEAVARICALSTEKTRADRMDRARTAIDRARRAVASGEAAPLRSALQSMDLLSFELCDD